MKKLHLTEQDIVIIDRSTEVGQSILEHKGSSKVGIVVHAEHYSENATNDSYIFGITITNMYLHKHHISIFISLRRIYKIKFYPSNSKIYITST